ncbi:hypothetical protein Agub_g5713 [Astrephomene gubernaculifera]|uniref:Uncharacterized protein n=1 Tax=Astrephomene gubernaculifera TaxID=47775 RepID=A0AAD3DN79_9CHLO|nr:hypothetical protein Agub_g5713 [Astrephomene gubernaculifera]
MRCYNMHSIISKPAKAALPARRLVACQRGYHTRTLTVRAWSTGEKANTNIHENGERRVRRYEAEFRMMSGRLAGVVHQAVSAAVHSNRDKDGGRAPSREVLEAHFAAPTHAHAAGPTHGSAAAAPSTRDEVEAAAAHAHALPPSPGTPAGMASAFLRCLEAQLQARKYMNAGDEAGDVLGSFPSATLLYYPGGGLQAVVEEVAAAAAEAHGPAGPAAVAVLRSLAGAVGRVAGQQQEAGGQQADKAASVVTCLLGTAEALEGATKTLSPSAALTSSALTSSALTSSALTSTPAPATTTTHRPATRTSAAPAPGLYEAAAVSAVASEAAELLWEVAGVLEGLAGSPSSSHTAEGHTRSPSAPAHPLLSALETRLYGSATWQPDSPAEIASSLVDTLASLLAPSHVGNTAAQGGAAARGSACAALHCMAGAQRGLAGALRSHGADPAAASRLLSALAEALAAACITRDAADPQRGPRPLTMFGEAQLLVGLSRIAAAEGPSASTPAATAAAQAADAAAGDASSDPALGVSDASLVLEVLAGQARQVAAAHREHIAQVLQDLRDVPRSLGALSQLPEELSTSTPAHQRPQRTAAATGGAASAAAAAASVAAENQAGMTSGGRVRPRKRAGL